MIDIVFLLIIFFITASQFTPLVYFPVRLPQVASPGDDPRLVPATINIDRDGFYVIGGERRTLEQVAAWLDDSTRAAQSQGQSLQLLIRSDREARSESVNRLLPKLAELGVQSVKFSVQGIGGRSK